MAKLYERWIFDTVAVCGVFTQARDVLGCSSLAINTKCNPQSWIKLWLWLLLAHSRNAIISAIFQALLNPTPLVGIAHRWCSKLDAHKNHVLTTLRTLVNNQPLRSTTKILVRLLENLTATKTSVLA